VPRLPPVDEAVLKLQMKFRELALYQLSLKVAAVTVRMLRRYLEM
jgi:hypothetical protein